MFDQIKKDLKVNGNSFLCLLFLPLFFLAGMGLVFAIIYTDDGSGWFCLGTLAALMMLALFVLFFFGSSYRSEFMVALSMGRTRKEFMAVYALRVLLWLVSAYLIILVLHRLELAVYTSCFPLMEDRLPLDFLYNWKLAAGVILGLTVLILFVGSMYCRFGKKFMGVLWFAWMGLCILGSSAPAWLTERLISWADSLSNGAWVAIGICAGAAMLATGVAINRKEMVR